MLKKNKVRAGLGALAVGGVLGASGFAFAALTSESTATAAGQSATMTALTVTNEKITYEAGVTKLWPGHSVGASFDVTNDNEVGVAVSKIELVKVDGDKSCTKLLRIALAGGSSADAADATSTHPFVLDPTQYNAVTVGPKGAWNQTQGVQVSSILHLPDTADNAACSNKSFSTTWRVTGSNL